MGLTRIGSLRNTIAFIPREHRGPSLFSARRHYSHLIVRPDCRRLVTSNRKCLDKYLLLAEEQWQIHRISERLEYLEKLDEQYPISNETALMFERLDKQTTEIFKHCESKCRKITKIDGEYSLSSKYWH
jgi:hypothetical protein